MSISLKPKFINKNKLSKLFLLVSIFLYHGCANRNIVRIVDTNFEEQIEELQNLRFKFSKALIADSLLSGDWDTTRFIRFEPHVPGSFKWINEREIEFSPSQKFEPGVQYKAIPTTLLLTKSQKKGLRIASNKIIHFHTAPIQVERVHSFLTRGNQGTSVKVQLDILFNYDTDVSIAASKLSLSANGNNIPFNTVNTGMSKVLSVQIEPFAAQDKDIDLKVSLNKGVPIWKSEVVTTNDTSFRTPIISRHVLKIINAEGQHDGTNGTIFVNLSQALIEQNLKEAISISPSVAFEVSTTDGGVNITSAQFSPQATYTLTFHKSIKGVYGGQLSETSSVEASFGTLEPAINFVNNKGMYLSSKGYKNVAVNIVQVPTIKLSVIKVYENNILQLFRQGESWGGEYDEESERYNDFQYYRTYNLGDTIFTRVYKTEHLPKSNAAHLLHLDFSDKFKGYDGVYIIQVESAEQRWVQSSKILSLSDIGLIVKKEENRILVFANSIRHASPLNNTKINFISTSNQIVYSTNTNSEGVAVFDNIEATAKGMQIGMVAAKKAEEYSFITFNQANIETSRYDIGGRIPNGTGLQAYLFAERNIYRPGETLNVSAIVRNENWQSPGKIPVKMILRSPVGKELFSKRLMLNEQGSCAADFPIANSAITGSYTLQLLSGNDILLNSYAVSIEDFMPDRIKVDIKLDKEQYEVGDRVQSKIQANNLFGTPATNRKYEFELNISKKEFKPKGFEEFNFNINKNFYFSTVFEDGATNDSGLAEVNKTLESNIANTGMLKGNIRATVFDETGRPVHRYASFDIHTQDIFLGIKNMDEYVNTNVPLKFNLIALDKFGKNKSTKAHVRVIRREWQNVMEESGNRYRYVSRWVDKELKSEIISIASVNTYYTFIPDQSGEYEIQIAPEKSDGYIIQRFYAYGYNNTQYSSFEVNNEGNVTIKTDKDTYSPDETVNILFTTPFEGRMLVAVERDKVMEYHFLNTKDRAATLSLKAKNSYLPNIYIAATLFRPMDGSELPLTVAHGYKNINFAASKNKLPIALTIAEKSRSQTKQTIVVKTIPNALVTIAAVDEGILQVKNYKAPTPYDFFYQKVALGVSSYDVYPLLLPELRFKSSTTGGDGADEENTGRVNPLFVNRVKNVSFWSGILKADAAGIVRYDIDVPQFSGAIRTMAVAYKDNAFGSVDNTMKVADPIVISTALPRFLSPEDELSVPVTLSNTTDKNVQAQVKLMLEGPLSALGTSTQTVSIAANKEARVVFKMAAINNIGAAKVNISVTALHETFENSTEIAVRPSAGLQRTTLAGAVPAGSKQQINLANNFLAGTAKGSITISNSPIVQFSKNLSYLVQYPHGCLEQTISAAFPQLYLSDLIKNLSLSQGAVINTNYNVQQAIYKLQSMQLPSGALSYWPGNDYESWWGSVYAAHFLLESQTAGFEVNESTLTRLMNYLKARLKKKEVSEYYFNGNKRKTIAAREIPYSLYVLALAKQPELSTMNFYKGNISSLSIEGKYLLAGAFTLTGQRDKAEQILPLSFSGEEADREFGGSFGSYIRDKAIALNTLLATNPNHTQVTNLAQQVSRDLLSSQQLSTQEAAWGILAMGKLAKKANITSGTANLWSNGTSILQTTGIAKTLDLERHLGSKLDLKVAGTGAFYYFATLSGISRDGSIKLEDKSMKVRRQYYDRNGEAITNNTFKQNQLIVVKVTISTAFSGRVDNVVISDILPAGLEVENTRLNELPDLKWVTEIKNKDEVDYLDVRDDRVNIFCWASGKPRTFYYMLRAVSPGKFKLGPIQADAMYNPLYYSYHGAGEVTVTP